MAEGVTCQSNADCKTTAQDDSVKANTRLSSRFASKEGGEKGRRAHHSMICPGPPVSERRQARPQISGNPSGRAQLILLVGRERRVVCRGTTEKGRLKHQGMIEISFAAASRSLGDIHILQSSQRIQMDRYDSQGSASPLKFQTYQVVRL